MNGLTRQKMVRSAGLSALCAGVMVVGSALVLAAGAAAQDPPGNNGTVKVDDQPIDSIPNNNPHVGCVSGSTSTSTTRASATPRSPSR